MEDKALKDCPFCGEEILKVAIKCKHCGSDLSKPVQTTTLVDQRRHNANIVALVGAAILVIGLFLPWMSAGIISVSGFQKVQDAVILLALGAAIGILSFIGMSTKKNFGFIIVLCSMGSLVLLVIIYIQMTEVVGGSGAFSPQIASGFYASAVGAFISLIGGVMMGQPRKKTKNYMVCTKCQEIITPQNKKCPQCGAVGNLIVHPRSDTGKKIVAELVSKNPEKYKAMAGVK